MFDLRNKNIYVGNQEVLKGYLGTNLLYDSVDLVFPEPPVYYVGGLSEWQYINLFFGSGEVINYGGTSNAPDEHGGELRANGLHLKGSTWKLRTIGRFDTPRRKGTDEFTIENYFPNLNNGSEMKIYYISNNDTADIYIGRDSEGLTYVRIQQETVYVPDTDYLNFIYSYRESSPSEILSLNGEEIYRKIGTSLNRETSVYIQGDILLYDLKVNTSWTPTDRERESYIETNYNGIKDLSFVRTDQL